MPGIVGTTGTSALSGGCGAAMRGACGGKRAIAFFDITLNHSKGRKVLDRAPGIELRDAWPRRSGYLANQG